MIGHRTVPVEPTEEMVKVGNKAVVGSLFFYGLAIIECYQAMLAAAPQPDTELAECVWTLYETPDYSIWETDCGESFSFTDDGPKENNFHFCHGCGRKLRVKE